MVKSRIFTKFLRDLRHSRSQLLSVILLSMLGVWVFSGLDGYWRNLDATVESYFDEQKLADFWIMTPLADEDPEGKISGIGGIVELQGRLSIEVNTVVPGDAKLMLHTVPDRIGINIPRITSGGPLGNNDSDECLLDEWFAEANGLSPGDTVTLKLGGIKRDFIIRGLVISPEHVFNAQDIIPEPRAYGFIYVKEAAFPGIAANEICVVLSDGADAGEVKAVIEAKLPGSFVIDRKAHKSTQLIRTEVSQFRSLSKIFPVIFFAVSVLVVMTAMTRIMSNQRTQLGLLKALGYGKGSIVLHYMSFGFFPSLTGAVCGLLLGRSTLPALLLSVIDNIYILPETRIAPLSTEVLAVCLMSILLTCVICYCTCRRSVSETAASLLRPKAPAAGSRILFERFSLVWERLSFSAKMIQRNLLRNRSRTTMALAGVLSCTALIITALGLMDSVDHMIGTYYGETLKYDLRADLGEYVGNADEYRKMIDADKTEAIMEMAVNIRKKGGCGSRTVPLTVVENDQELISLGKAALPDAKNRHGNGSRNESAVIVSEKLAGILGISVGDVILLRLPGQEKEDEVYVESLVQLQIGQGIFMSEKSWSNLDKGVFAPTALLVRNPSKAANDYLEGLDEVTGIKSLQSLREKTKAGMESMNSVCVLMVAFALVLAFTVLYNMGVLNFMERVREFATLKVLGFYHREIRSLIVRENIIVAVTGILSGIYPGIWLTDLVLKSSEPDEMVFVAAVEPVSIITACCITLVFSLLIQLLLTRKVRSIVMTEALKSVE